MNDLPVRVDSTPPLNAAELVDVISDILSQITIRSGSPYSLDQRRLSVDIHSFPSFLLFCGNEYRSLSIYAHIRRCDLEAIVHDYLSFQQHKKGKTA